jgi:hypothetical protein
VSLFCIVVFPYKTETIARRFRSLPSNDKPYYYSDDDLFDTGHPPTVTNRGHKLHPSARTVRRGRLGGWYRDSDGFEDETLADFSRKRLRIELAPDLCLVPWSDLPPPEAPALARLPPTPRNPLDLVTSPSIRRTFSKSNAQLTTLSLSAVGLIEADEPLMRSLVRVCDILRGDSAPFSDDLNEGVPAAPVLEKSTTPTHENGLMDVDERREEISISTPEAAEHNRGAADEAVAAATTTTTTNGSAAPLAPEADASPATEPNGTYAPFQVEEDQKPDISHQFTDTRTPTPTAETFATPAVVPVESRSPQPPPPPTADPSTSGDMDVDQAETTTTVVEVVPEAAEQGGGVREPSPRPPPETTAGAVEEAGASAVPTPAQTPAPEAARPPPAASTVTPAVVNGAIEPSSDTAAAAAPVPEPSSAAVVGEIEGTAAPPPPPSAERAGSGPLGETENGVGPAGPETTTAAGDSDEQQQRQQQQQGEHPRRSESSETGNDGDPGRRRSGRVANRSNGVSMRERSSSASSSATQVGDEGAGPGGMDEVVGQGGRAVTGGGGGAAEEGEGGEEGYFDVDGHLHPAVRRLVDPEPWVRSLFISDSDVAIHPPPASSGLHPVQQPPAPPAVPSAASGSAAAAAGTPPVVLTPEEQVASLRSSLAELQRLLEDSVEYQERLAEIRDGVLGVERRRKAFRYLIRVCEFLFSPFLYC